MKKNLFQNFSLFSPVSLAPLINIHSRISPRIFKKIWNGPNGILRGPGTLIYEKNLMSKISCQTPFKIRNSLKNTRKYNKQLTLFYTPRGWRTMHFLWKSKPKIMIWWIIQFYLYQYLPTFCLLLLKRTSLCIAILLYLGAFVCSRNIPYLKHILWVVTKLTLKCYVHQIAPHSHYSTGIIPLFCITALLYLPFGRDL